MKISDYLMNTDAPSATRTKLWLQLFETNYCCSRLADQQSRPPQYLKKLRRESIRLTQIQDIAGCRLIVADSIPQEEVVNSLTHVFLDSTVSDRRAQPSHGYRAHVIVNRIDKPVEIQVRTELQHLWAEQSEKLSDVVDSAIKYGGGDLKIQEILKETSDLVAALESLELELAAEQRHLSDLLSQGSLTKGTMKKLDKRKSEVSSLKRRMSKVLRQSFDRLPRR